VPHLFIDSLLYFDEMVIMGRVDIIYGSDEIVKDLVPDFFVIPKNLHDLLYIIYTLFGFVIYRLKILLKLFIFEFESLTFKSGVLEQYLRQFVNVELTAFVDRMQNHAFRRHHHFLVKLELYKLLLDRYSCILELI